MLSFPGPSLVWQGEEKEAFKSIKRGEGIILSLKIRRRNENVENDVNYDYSIVMICSFHCTGPVKRIKCWGSPTGQNVVFELSVL